MKYLVISALMVDDTVIPMSGAHSGKKFTVTDLHPDQNGKTVAVTLWDGWKEHTSHIPAYELVKRVW